MNNKKASILLILNLIFYAICDLKYLPIIGMEIIGSYGVYYNIKKENRLKKFYLVLGIMLEVCILGYFKYADFFLANKSDGLRILMPLGISYYTFKILSFLIDAYRGKIEYEITLLHYAVYVSFFPQIMCGPISRADELIKQLRGNCKITEEKVQVGLEKIVSGIFKKFVIADRLLVYTDVIFSNSIGYPTIARWMAAFFFAIQIYCDFAGYSEIAIGICNILGFECTANFDKPYFSANIKEFWGRWHISLSTWLRDYIYIPLGGNRVSKIRRYINVMITFLISGIWHGNGLNFICWGGGHGILSILLVKRSKKRWILFFQTIGTFICVMFGWIMFRAESFLDGVNYIVNMFRDFNLDYDVIVASIMPFTGDYSCVSYFLVVCILIAILFIIELQEYVGRVRISEKSSYIKSSFYLLMILLFGVIGQSSFLYANF